MTLTEEQRGTVGIDLKQAVLDDRDRLLEEIAELRNQLKESERCRTLAYQMIGCMEAVE